MSTAVQEAKPVCESNKRDTPLQSRPMWLWLSKLGSFIWSSLSPIFVFVKVEIVVVLVIMLLPFLLFLPVVLISMFIQLVGLVGLL